MVLSVHVKQSKQTHTHFKMKRNFKLEILQIVSSRLWYQVEGLCTFNLSGAGAVLFSPLILV